MATTIANSTSTQEKLLRAREAAAKLALLSTEEKNALLVAIADAVESEVESILAANRDDMENSGLEGAMRDRLVLTAARIKDMAQGVRDVATHWWLVLRCGIGEPAAAGETAVSVRLHEIALAAAEHEARAAAQRLLLQRLGAPVVAAPAEALEQAVFAKYEALRRSRRV